MGKLVADKCAKAEIEKKVYADMLKDSDLTKVVGKIKVPTLIIWGAKDKILHIDNAELFHQKIKGSKLIVFDDAGHVAPLEFPEKTAQAIEGFIQ